MVKRSVSTLARATCTDRATDISYLDVGGELVEQFVEGLPRRWGVNERERGQHACMHPISGGGG